MILKQGVLEEAQMKYIMQMSKYIIMVREWVHFWLITVK
jgi:hypothetical protein